MAAAAEEGEGAAKLAADSRAALNNLYATTPAAKTLGAKARAILVFPRITKAGLGIGAQYGDGALMQGGKAVSYYNTAGASYGLQAGAQQFGYAMFLMNDKAVKALDKVEGFEVGVGPTVVLVDEGMARTLTTTTMKAISTPSSSARRASWPASGCRATRSRRSIPNRRSAVGVSRF